MVLFRFSFTECLEGQQESVTDENPEDYTVTVTVGSQDASPTDLEEIFGGLS